MTRTDYAPELAAEIQRRTAMLAGTLAGAAETTDSAVRYRLMDDARELAAKIARDAAEIAGGEYRDEYNGWPNRESWNAALWIGNDAGADDLARELVRDALDSYETPELLADYRATLPADERARQDRAGALHNAADALREWWSEANYPGAPYEPQTGPLSDAWTYAVAVTDWRRIAEHYADELETEPAG